MLRDLVAVVDDEPAPRCESLWEVVVQEFADQVLGVGAFRAAMRDRLSSSNSARSLRAASWKIICRVGAANSLITAPLKINGPTVPPPIPNRSGHDRVPNSIAISWR
jgi:hypothetical protein